MGEIKKMNSAIETTYDGNRFRSRLEARWAVWFNAAGLNYVYEPEGFEFSDGISFLPDFYIPEWNAFVEIKPHSDRGVIERAMFELQHLLVIGKFNLFVFEGSPRIPQCENRWDETVDHFVWKACNHVVDFVEIDDNFNLGEDSFWARGQFLSGRKNECDLWWSDEGDPDHGENGWSMNSQVWENPVQGNRMDNEMPGISLRWSDYWVEVYERASMARFEHGETPSSKPVRERELFSGAGEETA